MAVFKRYNGRRIKAGNPDWAKAKWWVEFRIRGHRVLQALPEARTKSQAERAESKLKEQIFNRKFDLVENTMAFTEFVDKHYLPWAEANKESHDDDRRRAKLLKDEFGTKQLREISPFDIERLRASMIGKKTPRGTPRKGATVNRYRSLLSKIFSMAHDNGFFESNPCGRVGKSKEGSGRERYLMAEEEPQLMAALAGELEYLRPAIIVALGTGLRKMEMLSLRVGHVNFSSKPVFCPVNGTDAEIAPNRLLVVKSKNKKPRTIPMNESVRGALLALARDASADDLMFSLDRNGVSCSTIKRGFEEACNAAGITYGITRSGGLTWHDLRHSFATRLREQGVHELSIMQLMGHSSLSMVARYAHGTPDDLQRAVSSLAESPGRVVQFARKAG